MRDLHNHGISSIIVMCTKLFVCDGGETKKNPHAERERDGLMRRL